MQHLHDVATALKDKLYELTSTDVKALPARNLQEWFEWATGIEREFDDIEDTLANALRFFADDNVRILYALAAIEERNGIHTRIIVAVSLLADAGSWLVLEETVRCAAEGSQAFRIVVATRDDSLKFQTKP